MTCHDCDNNTGRAHHCPPREKNMIKLTVGYDETVRITFSDGSKPVSIIEGNRVELESAYQDRDRFRADAEKERQDGAETRRRLAEYNGECRRLRLQLDATNLDLEKALEKKTACVVIRNVENHLPDCAHFSIPQELWQLIATAPKDGSNVVLHCTMHGRKSTVVGQWVRSCEKWSLDGGDTFLDATHWMPLPAAPK